MQRIKLELNLVLHIQNSRLSYQFSDLFFIIIIVAVWLSNRMSQRYSKEVCTKLSFTVVNYLICGILFSLEYRNPLLMACE